MAEKKLSFSGEEMSKDVLERYKKVSDMYGIPLNIVASTGATESRHGADKRIEQRGNTQGLFHITKDAALDVARTLLKDEGLDKKISSLTEDQFRNLLLTDKNLEDTLGGGYLKLAYDRAKKDPIKTYGYYNAGIFNKKFNPEQLQNQKNFKQRYEDSFNYIKPTPKVSPLPSSKPSTSTGQKFKDTYSSLGKQKPLMFPSSYEKDEEGEDSEDQLFAQSSDSEELEENSPKDFYKKLESYLPKSEENSLIASQESEDEEEDEEEDPLAPRKSRFSGLRKIIS